MTNLQSTVLYCTPLNLRIHLVFCAFYQTDILELLLVEPHYEPNDDQFAKYCHTPQNHRSLLLF